MNTTTDTATLHTGLSRLSDNGTILITAVLAFAVILLAPRALDAFTIYRLPFVGQEFGGKENRRVQYLKKARQLYNEGYHRFKDGVYRITTSRTTTVVVVSPKFLNELKKLPDTVVSMATAVDEAMDAKYIKIETHVPIIPHTITRKLTPSLTRLNPSIAEEVKLAMQSEFLVGDEWTEISIHRQLTRVIAMVSGRIFIGTELSRTENYLDAAINYTLEVMNAQRAVQKLRPFLRPFLAGTLPEMKRLEKRIKEAEDFITPVIQLRREALKDGSLEKPDDMLQWFLDCQDQFPDRHSQNLAKVQLGLSFAAIHTTTLAVTNAFYDIAALPELVPELRQDIKQALEENGGIFTSQALQAMKKVDSFLKESLRLNPVSMVAFQRKVLKTVTLSNGQVLPAGVTIEVPAVAINSDPDVFTDPDTFDGLRFYRLRKQAGEAGSSEKAATNQFVSVSQDSLTFGYGRHACPGRFFAANEIKMIFANALMMYDIKLANGCTERYPNIEFAHMSIPDSSKTLLFRCI
ncbi:cytochrome P450 [Nemania sp. FL0031]|nr:cytochrome P450 [Nemania sp. FL0031]